MMQLYVLINNLIPNSHLIQRDKRALMCLLRTCQRRRHCLFVGVLVCLCVCAPWRAEAAA